jgi:hypothetical protein
MEAPNPVVVRLVALLLGGGLVFAPATRAAATALTASDAPSAGSFPLVAGGRAAELLLDPADARVVRLAADAFALDVERVTGHRPALRTDAAEPGGAVVVVGTIGRSATINRLAREGRIAVGAIRGRWESCLLTSVREPFPGVKRAWVVAGSDRRGTAYGLFELSRLIGVSPWVWWADVTPARRSELHLRGRATIGPPKVKYRGIFLNDEDFGLKPWAAETFEPETGDIGPKTYARVFELLLRLRANYCWPAMHECTRAFNHYAANKQVADDYGIVMGSSHCEPLLRDNPDEWHRDGRGPWDWTINRANIMEYWRTRVRENAPFENVWTIGMRGIHDSAMPGGGSLDEKTRRLEDVVAAQRRLLSDVLHQDAASPPQILIPYKETLALYENRMRLPEDVTIVWPDDNNGYIRRLSSPEEQRRSGGGGVYYHLSYLGAPISYIWLDSTPPAQIWQEMTKAYAHDCRRLWVVNVGDLKPMEKGMSYFLDLAWDPERPALADQRAWLTAFAAQNFGRSSAAEIGAILDGSYRLNHRLRPEHLSRESEFNPFRNGDEVARRLAAFDDLVRRAEAVEQSLPSDLRDAYFELVLYPVRASAKANEKLLSAWRSRSLAFERLPAANEWAGRAEQAQRRIQEDTRRYNEEVAGGKWRRMMPAAPYWNTTWDRPAGWVYARPFVQRVDAPARSRLAVMPEGHGRPMDADDQQGVPRIGREPGQHRFIDLFATGTEPVAVRVEAESWLRVDHAPALVKAWERLWIDVDWDQVPNGAAAGNLRIVSGDQTVDVPVPLVTALVPAGAASADAGRVALEAEDGIVAAPSRAAHWRRLDGIGWNGAVALIEPRTLASLTDLTQVAQAAPALGFRFFVPADALARFEVHALPTQPAYVGRSLRCALSLDGGQPSWVEFPADDEYGPLWSERVLRARMTQSTRVPLSAGTHELRLYGTDPSLVLDAVDVVLGDR